MEYQDNIKPFLGRIITNHSGKVLYYSPRWKEYLDLNTFTSEEFLCNPCLRRNQKLTKGFTRYDSLVVCEFHNIETSKINQQLRDILNRVGAKVYTDLGL